MPKLSEEVRLSLEAPIQREELAGAIKNMSPDKAPGPDGFTGVYYRRFQEQLNEHFLEAFNYAGARAELPPDVLRAFISLIPKEGKDKSNCASYRPISLLNQDVKIYAKILADRLLPWLPNLIHLDQVGFIPTREARDNVVKTLGLVHQARLSQRPSLLLSMDAEKAFDRVNGGSLELHWVGYSDEGEDYVPLF